MAAVRPNPTVPLPNVTFDGQQLSGVVYDASCVP
jgi:hypothetical protein